jgi:two-component system, OmpR family, response regulator
VRILLAEDENELAEFLVTGLRAEGFVLDHCSDGREALHLLAEHVYEAAVLDIMLPGRDGLSIIKLLRQRGNNVPVVIITARDQPEEKIEGLNLGADDYLAKPFYLEELVARLHAIWRRTAGRGLSVIGVRDLRVNLMTREVTRNERHIDLTPREFSLLVYLLQSPGRVRTRTQILDRVWDYQFNPGTNLVDVYMRRVRAKIDCPGEVPLFETVRGIGYRIRSAF